MIEAGIYPNMSNEEYHADTASISRSAIKEFMKTPYHYWARYINPDRPKQEQTDAMMLGSAFHTLVIEPHLFYEQYAIEPEKVLLKDVGRERYDQFKAEIAALEASNKIVLTSDQFLTLQAMAKAVNMDEYARELLHGGQNESSFFWKDKETDLMVKARPDVLHKNMIIDLKTCANASPESFRATIADQGYHIQGAMMRDAIRELQGRDVPNFICVAVEKTYPFAVGIHIIGEQSLDTGRIEYKEVLAGIKHGIVYNKWESYGVNTLELPRWYNY